MKHIPTLLMIACAATALPGCSLFSKSVTPVTATQATPTTSKPAPTPSVSDTPSAGTASPADRQDNPAPVANTPSTVNATKHNLGGEWLMVQVGSQTLDRDEDMPYIIFDTNGRFYGNDGCNTVNGNYTLSADDKFAFSGVITTMRYCPDQDIQHTIATVIADGASVQAKFTEVGSESFIDLIGASGKTAVRLRRANIDFLNGHWEVLAINGTSVDPAAPADVFFDIAERKIHGNTGCNYFNGEIYLDHRQPNAIDFSKMGVTRMACPFTAQETAFLVALEETTTALSGGKDSAMLLDSEGRELLILRRMAE